MSGKEKVVKKVKGKQPVPDKESDTLLGSGQFDPVMLKALADIVLGEGEPTPQQVARFEERQKRFEKRYGSKRRGK